MKLCLPLIVTMIAIGCASPSEKLAERSADGILEPSLTAPEVALDREVGGADRVPEIFSDLWRDSIAGWSVFGRAMSRAFARDTDRIGSLFD